MSDPRLQDRFQIDRRSLLVGGGLALAGAAGAATQALQKPAPVFIAAGQSYTGRLVTTIADGLRACGLDPTGFRGKRVLLKPNLVEPSRRVPHMTTHPAMVIAAAEVFRGWGAQVTVGEAPGHLRDTEVALVESGLAEALSGERISFADLNYEEVGWRRNRGRFSKLPGIFFPRTVLEADLIVSMPKLKTHHWVGVTCATKNLYGILPGIKYGWPKNVLHHHGIPQTVADIAASAPQTIAIVDGIDCMEGDGPILGSMKHMGLILIGAALPAVDATAARIMGLEPSRIEYLQLAARRLGSTAESRIEQRGESWLSVASPFHVLDEEHLQRLRAVPSDRLVS